MIYLDPKDGFVDYCKFLSLIRGQPDSVREAIIKVAFNKFDTYGEGCVHDSDLESVFCCPSHPKVLSGEMTNNDVFI